MFLDWTWKCWFKQSSHVTTFKQSRRPGIAPGCVVLLCLLLFFFGAIERCPEIERWEGIKDTLEKKGRIILNEIE